MHFDVQSRSLPACSLTERESSKLCHVFKREPYLKWTSKIPWSSCLTTMTSRLSTKQISTAPCCYMLRFSKLRVPTYVQLFVTRFKVKTRRKDKARINWFNCCMRDYCLFDLLGHARGQLPMLGVRSMKKQCCKVKTTSTRNSYTRNVCFKTFIA